MCGADARLSLNAEAVKDEFDRVTAVDTMISDQQQQLLNRVLHTTRAMDTCMKTFLEINGVNPSGDALGIICQICVKEKRESLKD